MRLLFDHHLPVRLVGLLTDLHPDSASVSEAGLAEATDSASWEFARSRGFAIVTKDQDYERLSRRLGHPPKVIWLRIGNCSVREAAALMRASNEVIVRFLGSDEALLVLPF